MPKSPSMQRLLHAIWWLMLVIFFASAITAIVFRSTGYSHVIIEGDRYYLTARSTRDEVSREVYEEARWHNRVSGVAAFTMGFSLFSFLGLESLRLKRGKRRR